MVYGCTDFHERSVLNSTESVVGSGIPTMFFKERRPASLDPLWHLLDRHQSIAFSHPTSPPNFSAVALDRPRPMLEFMFETTRSVVDLVFAAVIERYSNVRFVIPHCGAALPAVADQVELFRSLLPGSYGRAQSRLSTREQLQR
jgi:hypothetical protein